MDHSKEAVNVFNDLATVYEAKYMKVHDKYVHELNFFCDRVGPSGKVLELACGPGNLTKYILNKRSDLLYTATDLSENMIALAKKNNPGIETQILDCRNISSIKTEFDGVVSGFCLPYLNMDEVLKKCSDIYELLSHNGLLYLSGIEGKYSESAYVYSISNPGYKVFTFYYCDEEVSEILTNIGFKVLHKKKNIYTREDKTEIKEFVIVARKI